MARTPRPKVGAVASKVSQALGNVTTGALLGGVLALIAAGIIRLIGSQLKTSYLTLLAVGLLLILFAAFTGYNAIRSNVLSRKGFYGLNTTLMVLLFLAIASIVIFVGAKNNARFDVTSAKEFSLAEQTVKILKDLKQNVEAVAFFVPTNPNQITVRGPTQDLLEEYSHNTGRFTYRIVDPDIEPEEARRLGINPDTEPGTIVFTSEGNLQAVKTLIFTQQGGYVRNQNLEKDFSQSILAVTRARQKVVYFLVRHGESDASNLTEGNGYGLARRGLEGDNYVVKPLDLAGAGKIPADAALIVIAGPKNDLQEEEKAPLNDFLLKGGKAMFLLDPGTPSGFREVIRTWGVDIGNGTLVDVGSSVSGNPRAPLVTRARYNYLAPTLYSPITQPITDSTFYERATAVIPLENQGKDLQPAVPNVFYNTRNLLITPLAVTTDIFSWLTPDPQSNTFHDGDTRGPLAIGVSIDARAPFKQEPANPSDTHRTQIVVIGDSDFASNRFYTSFANGDMFLNSVNWLTGDVDLISVRPKLREPRLLIVTQGTFNFIRWSSLLILPLTLGAAGAYVYWRRR